jgi:Glycosyltransferase family 87
MRKTWESKSIRLMALVLLGIAALISLVTGVRHAIEYRSHDLQWMGARLVWQHIDPWQEVLEHFPHHYVHFVTPNYLHPLYLILLPLGRLSFESAEIVWMVGTICLSIASILMLRRLFNLDRYQTLVALCLLWMSSPFRVVLEVGQMSFFELFFLTGAYVATSTALGGLSFGFSLAKYSFAPVAAMLFLFRGRLRFLFFAAVVPIVGVFGVWLFLRTPLPRLAIEPFAVSASPTAISPGFGDLMTLTEQALKSHIAGIHARQCAYALGLFGSAVYAFLLSRFRLSRSAEFTLISIASLFFVQHLVYDYVFLVVPLCYALTQKSLKIKVSLIGGVLIFWFLLTFLGKRLQSDRYVHVWQLAINCFLLAVLLAFTTRHVIRAADQTPKEQESELEVATRKLRAAS